MPESACQKKCGIHHRARKDHDYDHEPDMNFSMGDSASSTLGHCDPPMIKVTGIRKLKLPVFVRYYIMIAIIVV